MSVLGDSFPLDLCFFTPLGNVGVLPVLPVLPVSTWCFSRWGHPRPVLVVPDLRPTCEFWPFPTFPTCAQLVLFSCPRSRLAGLPRLLSCGHRVAPIFLRLEPEYPGLLALPVDSPATPRHLHTFSMEHVSMH